MPGISVGGKPKLRLESRFTGMRTAFDPIMVADLLQRSVIGHSDLLIEECTPGKAYVESDLCLLRYSLKLRGAATGRMSTAVLTGRLFPDPGACRRFFNESIAPLASRVEGRDELSGFHSPAALFEDLRLVVCAFPIDPDLPSLIEATEPSHMAEILGRLVSASLAPRFDIEGCRIAVAHYPRRRRCVLRYEIDGRLGEDKTSAVVYGKLSPEEEPPRREVVEELARDLIDGLGDGRGPVRIPRHVGHIPRLDLVLIEGIPGRPEIAPWIRAAAAGAGEEQLKALERAVEVAGRVAASVHRSAARPARERPLKQELLELREETEALRHLLPEEVAPLEDLLSEVTSAAAASAEDRLHFSHGDFTPSQILFDDAGVGLIDFDNLCRAERALDLGQFCAYMTAATVKARSSEETAHGLGPQLRQRFLKAYTRAAGLSDSDELYERVRTYERLSLLRMSVRALRQLKPARARVALEAFRETGRINGGLRKSDSHGPRG